MNELYVYICGGTHNWFGNSSDGPGVHWKSHIHHRWCVFTTFLNVFSLDCWMTLNNNWCICLMCYIGFVCISLLPSLFLLYNICHTFRWGAVTHTQGKKKTKWSEGIVKGTEKKLKFCQSPNHIHIARIIYLAFPTLFFFSIFGVNDKMRLFTAVVLECPFIFTSFGSS